MQTTKHIIQKNESYPDDEENETEIIIQGYEVKIDYIDGDGDDGQGNTRKKKSQGRFHESNIKK